jgi:ribosomal protein L11 methyltransferase
LKSYPALDVQSQDIDLLYAALDDFAPSAIEERPDGLRAFFPAGDLRDRALAGLSHRFVVSSLEVGDEDWARRSQEHLQPVTVGRITILPRTGTAASPIAIVIQPSMGFGTGHHATTRLCLAALQEFEPAGRTFLDLGTGSGVLAIAASRLGARQSTGIDVDADAIQAAQENLALNPGASGVSFAVMSLERARPAAADIVAANLTGALLIRSARAILDSVVPGGLLILSGIMRDERDDVREAFRDARVEWEQSEDEWIGLAMKKS